MVDVTPIVLSDVIFDLFGFVAYLYAFPVPGVTFKNRLEHQGACPIRETETNNHWGNVG